MKAIALALSLCLSFNVLAASGTIQELERSFDDYTYAVTVEWDQKDKDFHQNATKKLFNEIDALVKSGEISKNDILKLAEKKIGDQKSLNTLRTKLSLLVNEQMTAEEIASVLYDQSAQFYERGASWSGDVYYVVSGLAVMGLLITLMIIGSKDSSEVCTKVSYENVQCNWQYPTSDMSQPAVYQCYPACVEWGPAK